MINLGTGLWRGLTYATHNHNRISQIALLWGRYAGIFVIDWDKQYPMKDSYEIFGEKITREDLRIGSNVTESQLEFFLTSSHVPDLKDKGVIKRRYNHANINGEWERNFIDNHYKILEYTEGDYEEDIKALMIGYNIHYLQDAISPMHTHTKQVDHFAIEHSIDNSGYWNSFVNTYLYAMLYKYGFPRLEYYSVEDIVKIVNKYAQKGLQFTNSGIAGFINKKELEFNRWIFYYAYHSIVLSMLYYYQFYGV